MPFNKQKNKYCTVNYSKGGGTYLVDVPMTAVQDNLLAILTVSGLNRGVSYWHNPQLDNEEGLKLRKTKNI